MQQEDLQNTVEDLETNKTEETEEIDNIDIKQEKIDDLEIVNKKMQI